MTTRRACVLVLLALTSCKADGEHGTAADTSSAAEHEGGATSSGTTTSTAATSDTSTSNVDTTGDGNACNDSAEALADCVEAERYADDLEFVTGVRNPASAHWQEVQDLCADRLTELGYTVQLFDYGTGIDVLGRREGASLPDEIVMVGAHYDHLPDCNGADDNATGVAATLEVARMLAMAELQRSVVIACWDEEEDGLVGSRAFATSAAADGLDIATYINFDMIGFYTEEPDSQMVPAGLDIAFPEQYADVEADMFRGDFIAVVPNQSALATATDFAAQGERVGLRSVVIDLPAGTENADVFADLRRSDHAAFWEQGFPAMMVSDTGELRNDHYHCTNGPDEIADLDQDFAVGVTRAAVGAAALAAGL
ncbi:MAG TPA: M20/M25/M40 family metallo-hydrolase [Nannocystaceae bacterium]|nr:M20/M25/M40 family metallo-hydrolase [Nannocystaceae bacterium]